MLPVKLCKWMEALEPKIIKMIIFFNKMEKIDEILYSLSKSKFRSSFHLKEKDKEYIKQKGIEKIESHAYDFLRKRLAPAYIPNDGKQTPMRGHPVFIAEHATATCCRNCLYKWYHIPKGRELTEEEIVFLVTVIMTWIKKELVSQ